MFKKGGAWDKFAGDDGRLSFEEMKKMNKMQMDMMEQMVG